MKHCDKCCKDKPDSSFPGIRFISVTGELWCIACLRKRAPSHTRTSAEIQSLDEDTFVFKSEPNMADKRQIRNSEQIQSLPKEYTPRNVFVKPSLNKEEMITLREAHAEILNFIFGQQFRLEKLYGL